MHQLAQLEHSTHVMLQQTVLGKTVAWCAVHGWEHSAVTLFWNRLTWVMTAGMHATALLALYRHRHQPGNH